MGLFRLLTALMIFAISCAPAAPTSTTASPTGTSTLAAATAAPSSASPVRFALLTILSGTAQALGEQHLQGVQMAVDQINASGGINGAQIQLDIQDTAFDRQQAVALVRKAAADKTILAVNGPLSTPEIVAASPVCAEVQIVCLSAGSTSPWQGTFNEWTFRSNLISIIALPAVLKAVKAKLPIKSIAIMYDVTNDCSVGETKMLRESIAPQMSFDVVATEGYRGTDIDFTPQLTNILPKKPDLLYVTGVSDQAALIIQQARQRGYTGEILGGCSDLNDAKIYQLSSGAAKGAITFSSFDPNDTRPIVQDFVKRYKDKYNQAPSSFVSGGYDSLMLFADAARRAKATTDRKAFRDALGSTSGLEGVNGKYTYKNSGDNQTPGFSIFRVKEGGGLVPF